MNQQDRRAREQWDVTDRPKPADRRGFSQIVFVMFGLAIIVGGIWTLYMGDAPYHPQDFVTRDSLSLTGN